LPDLRGRLSRVPAFVREGLAELIERIEKFMDPEEGLLVRLELLCEIERHADVLWEHPRKTIPDRALSPIYGGLGMTPQFGFVPLERDAKTGLWTFVHFLGLKVPPRDAAGRLDTKALVLKRTSVLRFRLLPGGRFRTGPPSGEGGEGNREVTVGPFFLGIYEVTEIQWIDVMGDIHPEIGRRGGPATDLSPQDCLAFAELTGLSIPTEAQWEYACRAGSDAENLVGDSGDFEGCYIADPARPPTGPESVDAFAPNAFGLHNLRGNVGEICMSTSDPDRDRIDLSTWTVRGGSWKSLREDCRPWSRRQVLPGYRSRTNGFRPARLWIVAR
jgi:formylglycine-generating enzyme required for sulfatase activity